MPDAYSCVCSFECCACVRILWYTFIYACTNTCKHKAHIPDIQRRATLFVRLCIWPVNNTKTNGTQHTANRTNRTNQPTNRTHPTTTQPAIPPSFQVMHVLRATYIFVHKPRAACVVVVVFTVLLSSRVVNSVSVRLCIRMHTQTNTAQSSCVLTAFVCSLAQAALACAHFARDYPSIINSTVYQTLHTRRTNERTNARSTVCVAAAAAEPLTFWFAWSA